MATRIEFAVGVPKTGRPLGTCQRTADAVKELWPGSRGGRVAGAFGGGLADWQPIIRNAAAATTGMKLAAHMASRSFLYRFLQHLLHLRSAPDDKAHHLHPIGWSHCAIGCSFGIDDLPFANEHEEVVGAGLVAVEELGIGTILRDRFGNFRRQRADI